MFRPAIDLVAALIATLPNTAVRSRMIIAGHLHELDGYAGGLVQGREGGSDHVGGTGRTDAVLRPAEAVFAAGPFCQGEVAGRGVVGGFADVGAVHGVVEPLAGVRARVGHAVQVFDADAVGGVDGEPWGARFGLA